MSDFDAIVVGAGVAGSTAAYQLAQSGLEVLLLDRSAEPGSKNLSGGIFYGRVLPDIIPNFYQEAPIERLITRNVVMFQEIERSLSIDFADRGFAVKNDDSATHPANGFSVLRGKFDSWLAEKAEEAGASLVPGILVDDLIIEGGVCKGVIADGEEMTADCVIVADGINSKLTERLGQRDGFDIHDMGVGVKYLYRLDEETINERFRCLPGEGIAYGIMGSCTEGVPGGGFLYTNKDTISVGVVVHIDHLSESGKTPYDLLDNMVSHPEVARMLDGGEIIEYGAHMVAEGGKRNLPSSLYGDGWMIVGDAAGFASNNGFTVRGMDFAAKSGALAAQAVIEAKKSGDFSAATLSSYKDAVDASFIGSDMNTYSGAPGFMKNEKVYTELVALVCSLFDQVYEQNSSPKRNLLPTAMSAMKDSGLKLTQLASLGLKAVKSL